ncbi:MAG: glutamate--tRNA ligase [Ignavibacteriales bacterium]
MINEFPRVRFAPSPTGYLHVGGLRTALYNYLFAKRNNGKFILRIEDTDRNRFVEGAVENLIDTLKWSGLNFDEGPNVGGDFGPYIQSQRLEIYQQYANELLEKGLAYRCFCTPERLENLREEQKRLKLPQAKYDKHCLNLTREEIKNNLDAKLPFTIRLNVTPGDKILIDDIIRGKVEFDRATIDDQVLIKSDGFPTYHLANVVDDHLMKITHVIRGEEWLSSTPKHVLLYNNFGWEVPAFAHLPLLLNPDGSKLSKRQGDVAVEDYREKGYFKEALINFVALLGWSAGDNQEFYYLNELAEKFSLERVQKSGSIFNIEKLNWLNFEHLRKKSIKEILQLLREEINKSEFAANSYSDEFLTKIIHAMIERVNFVKEFITNSLYFFKAPNEYDESSRAKNWKPETSSHLIKLCNNFDSVKNNSKEEYEHALAKTAEELGIGKGKLIHPLRLAVSGVSGGPGIYDILEILGKDETIQRIKKAVQILG